MRHIRTILRQLHELVKLFILCLCASLVSWVAVLEYTAREPMVTPMDVLVLITLVTFTYAVLVAALSFFLDRTDHTQEG